MYSQNHVADMTLILLSLIMVIELKAMVPIKLLRYMVLATSQNLGYQYVSHMKEAMMFLPQTNYFNFGQRKLAHQRCAKILLTINITLQYNSHCVESE